MRRGLLAALAAAMLVSALGVTAEAQSPRWWMRMQRMQQMQDQRRDPGFFPDAPPPAFMPPSAAARRALRDNPGSRLLGIRRNNQDYVITLRQRGAVRRIIIPGN